MLHAGIAQVDITPRPGVELSGFAARQQPSTGVLDPLLAKALWLASDGERVLWIHCDLVGLDREIVLAFRRWARRELGIDGGRVVLSATHTHSGPPTIHLAECGEYDGAYAAFLQERLQEAAARAAAAAAPCEVAMAEGRLGLAVDRRRRASTHTDPRVAAIGLRRPGGDFAAAIVNFPIHPVALGASNRKISGDLFGRAAAALSRRLPGHPAVLMTNGACGNLNPPAEDVSETQLERWGEEIAAAASPVAGAPCIPDAALRVASRVVPLPLEVLDAAGIDAFAARALEDRASLAAWGDTYRRAVESWRRSLQAAVREKRAAPAREAELSAIRLGEAALLGLNAEVFSEFADWLRRDAGPRTYVLGYANGDLGYLATSAAYAEGGYEVDVAPIFYGGFRCKAGGLETIAREAAALVRTLYP